MSSGGIETSQAGKSLIQRIQKVTRQYYELTNGPVIEVPKVSKNHDRMESLLITARKTNSPIVILAVEEAILSVDARMLEEFIDEKRKNKQQVTLELRSDLTSLKDALRQIRRAAKVFAFRQQYGEAAYHDISAGSRSEKDVDQHGTAVDVLREACKSHATRLQNMARGGSRTELVRKAQAVMGMRRQNMTTCETLY